MPLLQETTTQRDLLGREIKVEPQENTDLKNQLSSMQFPNFGNSAMFTPSQILMASQMLAATGLGIQPHPAFFHPALFAPWSGNSPPSPPTSTEQTSPALKSRKNNNNNNVVTSSSSEPKRKMIKIEEEPLASPTSSSSPPSESGSTKDSGRDKQFTCGVCNRSFGYKHVLQNHERTHTGEKPFECPQCHKRFTRDHHLKTHMRLHTGERPYHCEHCDRQFVQVANLRRHLRVHTGERPYACEHCNSRFSDSNQLKAHVLIHTNEKPFVCEKCHARFRRRHHLLHHKCGKDESTMEERITRLQSEQPLVGLPLQISLPEQTEPEDLSMSTGLHSHSSGDSPLSRSPSPEEYDVEQVDDNLYFQTNKRMTMAKRTHS